MKSKQICQLIKHNYETDNGNVFIYGKIGISTYPNSGRSYEKLFEAAQNSLYFAKHSLAKDFACDDKK